MMNRRELLLAAAALLTAARPLRAQQRATPVIGFLSSEGSGALAPRLAAFRQGLSETGYVEGQNVAIEYRWAEGHFDRLSALAADLVSRRVDVIVTTGGNVTALAAKNATASIPIVFLAGADPVEEGLVASLAAPSGNLTGVTLFAAELWGKRVELLSELVPGGGLAQLVNPQWPGAELAIKAVQEGARAKGRLLRVVKAGDESDIDAAFASLVDLGAGGLLVGDPTYLGRREQIVALAARYAVPTI
jgi:putative ABC transport system substrate-binding protein